MSNPQNPGYPSAPPPYYDGQQPPNAPPNYFAQQTGQPVYPNLPPQDYTGHPVPQPQAQVIVQPVAPTTITRVVAAPALGRRGTRTTCRNCQAEIETRATSRASIIAWISAGVICLIGGFCGCCLIPFCIENCKDVEHSCPSCGAYLGKHSAF